MAVFTCENAATRWTRAANQEMPACSESGTMCKVEAPLRQKV